MTKLTKPISRVSAFVVRGRNVIVTLAPLGGQADSRIGFRLHGKRLQYIARVSDMYVMAAHWYGARERKARLEARKLHIPWRTAKKKFLADNTITKQKKSNDA